MATFTFLDMAGKTLFVRDDAERAQWTQEEMTLELEFPRVEGKVVSTGQRVLFNDPATGAPQIYEIKQAKTIEPDHYQSITAENICISELSDEHIDEQEITDTYASDALESALSGTLWNVGTVAVNPVSSLDVSRGSVWQAVLNIKSNWNVYIEPRVSITASGKITRYMDILPTSGTWNGVRLSVDKNFLAPSVIYDDSEVITAIYGYGGTTTPESTEEEEYEITIADAEWAEEDGHPAKPYGQPYLEDPEATALYGRNGRARFGFYQNTDILDADTLLEKCWEALQASSKPSISIEGTVEDLRLLGYADEPIKLHDIALVEVLPAGFKDRLQIIRITSDLLDPSQTSVTIGDYIPNIVYIERSEVESITGTTGGGGGGSNKSEQTERSEYETAIEKNNRMIRLRAYQNDLDDLDNEVKIQEGRITIEHNRITAEVADRRNADNILNASITIQANRITQEVTERKGETTALSSRITQEAGRITQEISDRRAQYDNLDSRITQTATNISLEVERASRAEGLLSGRISVNADNITAEVTRAKTQEGDLSGRITVNANSISAEVTRAQNRENTLSGRIDVNAEKVSMVVSEKTGGGYEVNSAEIVAGINGQTGSYVKIKADTIDLTGYVRASQLAAEIADIQDLTVNDVSGNYVYVEDEVNANMLTARDAFTFGEHEVGWCSKNLRYFQVSTQRAFCYGSTSGISGTITGSVVLSTTDSTIYYLGRT